MDSFSNPCCSLTEAPVSRPEWRVSPGSEHPYRLGEHKVRYAAAKVRTSACLPAVVDLPPSNPPPPPPLPSPTPLPLLVQTAANNLINQSSNQVGGVPSLLRVGAGGAVEATLCEGEVSNADLYDFFKVMRHPDCRWCCSCCCCRSCCCLLLLVLTIHTISSS